MNRSHLIKSLPLLDFSSNYFSSVNLKNTAIICVQHLFSTTYNMFDKFLSRGLNPKNLFVIGKCYSTDPKVLEQLKKDGISVSEKSALFNSHIAYDDLFEEIVSSFFDWVLSKTDLSKYEKVIILDDGGFLIRQANQKLSKNTNVVGVEQTSAGYNRNKRENLFFQVINASRSWIKLKYETPMIIENAIQQLNKKISQIQPKPKKILIMGVGSLGERLFSILKDHYIVACFDQNPKKSMFRKELLKSVLKHYDLIIGATGETSITKQYFQHLKKPVTLASVSSSDREFDSVFLRKQVNYTENCFSSVEVGNIKLLNCGFPINFNENVEESDSEKFQLTRAFILGSVCEAYLSNMGPKGFIDLNNHFQTALESELLKRKII